MILDKSSIVKVSVLVLLVLMVLTMCAAPILLRPHGQILERYINTDQREQILELRTYDRHAHSYIFSLNYRGLPHGIAFRHQGISISLLDVSASNPQGFTVTNNGSEGEFKLGNLTLKRTPDWMSVYYGMNAHDFRPETVLGDALVIDGVEIQFGSDAKVEVLTTALGVNRPLGTWHSGMD